MDAWVSLLIQVPLVGVFVWYSLNMNKSMQESQQKFMEALDRRDAEFMKRNEAVIHAIDGLNNSICAQLQSVASQLEKHDDAVEVRFARAVEEVKPKTRTK